MGLSRRCLAGVASMLAISSASGVVLLGAPAAKAQVSCRDTDEGRICTTSQPIVSGALVAVDTQRQLGLVTVGGGCSGTLINRYWVLTADHCVNQGAVVPRLNVFRPGSCVPSLEPNNVVITAAWSGERVVPTRLVRDWCRAGLDLALIYLGAGDFGPANIQLLATSPVEANSTLVKYGRGISSFATAGPPPAPAVQDGLYRTSTFTASASGPLTYTLQANSSSQVGHGGDSGGPDVLISPRGVSLGIAGVQSTCQASGVVAPNPLRLPGGAVNWPWVTGIPRCNSAPLALVRYDIVQIALEKPAVVTPALYLLGGS